MEPLKFKTRFLIVKFHFIKPKKTLLAVDRCDHEPGLTPRLTPGFKKVTFCVCGKMLFLQRKA